jgi:hypothetical protein
VRKSIISLVVMGLVFGVVAVFVGSDLVVSAQNTNSSTTAESTPKPRSRRGRGRAKKPAATADTTADASAMPEATPAPRTGRCDPMQQEQTDLSGTYTGNVNYPEASLTGDATLTITGNDFTLTAGSTTQTGRITAVTTCNYTGATMMFGDMTAPDPTKPPPPPLPAVSLRAKKMGNRVTLTSVPGETRSFSFGSAGARPRMTHRRRAAPPPPPPAPPEQ